MSNTDTGILTLGSTEKTIFDAHGVNTTLDIALAKGLHSMTSTSISELTSDHNPMNFDINPLSTCSFSNWNNFQTVLSGSIPGNPANLNEEDIEQSISNFNNRIQEAIHATSTYKAIHHPVNTIPRQLRGKLNKKIDRKEWQQTKYLPLKTQVNRIQREIKSAINNYKNHIRNIQLQQANTDDNSLYKLFTRNDNKLSQIPPILGFPRPCLQHENKN
ncbi:putative RNA-directed DNA polymerase from transposon X-element [Trichonephila clavata]|uniref:Putative RNA-directed DNA polymerase from transposon X-element n=1 Tax=Trichonephila clavata TaxID=2740835 RepID=A0A8X6G8R2_TRICU|nr:putative RNA-directed DNA polymerase from transposon X-element [Trichonephila clavata]